MDDPKKEIDNPSSDDLAQNQEVISGSVRGNFVKDNKLPVLFFGGLILFFIAVLAIGRSGDGPLSARIDDWQFEPGTYEESLSSGLATTSISGGITGADISAGISGGSSDSIGFSVGGSADINSFRRDIENDFLPAPTDISHEGLYNDYLFDTGQQEECAKLFCPSYSSAISKDPFSNEDEYFISVGLNSGIKQSDFERKKLNLVIVMDISGSMSSGFNSYYYDGFGNEVSVELSEEDKNKTKMEIANQAAADLLDKLDDDDSVGVVLFDDQAHIAKPLRSVRTTDIDAIQGHFLEVQPQGGTNMSAGMKQAVELFEDYENLDSDEYENRIIFLTDAQPNTGALSEEGMVGIAKDAADNKINSSFIGIGLDFNTELVTEITKIRGSNYYTVNSSDEFRQRMVDQFDFMVTPLVFDLSLNVQAPGFEIQDVYGAPEAEKATGEVLNINTLFPSERTEGETRGGVVILHMKKTSDDPNVTISTNYQDRNGTPDSDSVTFEFSQASGDFPNTGIRKAVSLARYVNLLQSWTVFERDLIDGEREDYFDLIQPGSITSSGIPVIEIDRENSRWEQSSLPLQVSSGYRGLITNFRAYMSEEVPKIGDEEMNREIRLLDTLLQE